MHSYLFLELWCRLLKEYVFIACFEINRDIVKKKRDEQLKMVWRVSPAHKKLQLRMEQMRKFRRQHEQLRTVIVRVLRPSVVKTTTLADGDTAELKPEMDAADLNAIEEVWLDACLISS